MSNYSLNAVSLYHDIQRLFLYQIEKTFYFTFCFICTDIHGQCRKTWFSETTLGTRKQADTSLRLTEAETEGTEDYFLPTLFLFPSSFVAYVTMKTEKRAQTEAEGIFV